MSEALSNFVHINLCCGMKHHQHLLTSFLLIKDQSNYYYAFEMSAAYFLVIVVVCCFSPFPNFYCRFSRQCCETFGISQYHVFIYLVDYWILLGISWWSSFSPRFSSALLVCPLSLSFSTCLNIFSFMMYWSFSKSTDIYLFFVEYLWPNICALQVMYSLSWFWCFLCRFLCCAGLCHWYRCLLLSSMYHCTSLCCCRPGDYLFISHLFPVLFFF